MSATTAPQLYEAVVGETRLLSVDFTDMLESGELLVGPPTVAEVTTTDLTIDNSAVSVAILSINERSVAIGAAVQFRVSGQLNQILYTIKITIATDASPAQTFVRYVQLRGVNPE